MYKNFEEMILTRAKERAQDTFLFAARTDRSMNYGTFSNQVQIVKAQLQKMKVTSGDRVLILMDNSPEFAIDYFAVTAAGAVAVPVNTHLKWKEIKYILEDSGAVGILADTCYLEQMGELALQGWEPLQENTWFLQVNGDTKEKLPEDIAMILYTSGTTGHPKGVLLTYKNLFAKAEDIIEAHQLTEKDGVLCVLPWFHINGLVITLITPFVSGECIIIGGKFSVRHFWEDVNQYGATWFSGVPTMYSHMLARGIPEEGKHSCLRFARSASSPLPTAVLDEFEGICQVPIIESYGITEGAAQITTNPLPPAVRKPGSVGLAYGNRIKIMGSDGREMPIGEKGEVWIQGDNITCGYYHKEEETKKAFTGDWFHSGDLGYLDEDGYLFLDGRIKELINRAGEKFSPVEVDEVLYQIPEVELAATVGVPDEVYGEKTAAFIKLKETCSLTEEKVIDWCRERIASYKVPDMVYFVADIPKGGNGKIQRLKLKETFQRMKKGE